MQTVLYESAISFAMLLAAIPSILVFAAGQWYLTRKGYEDRARSWILIWLVCAILLGLPFAIFSAGFFNRAPGLIPFLMTPALIGLLSLLLIHWREVYSLWRKQVVLVSILVSALVLILASTAFGDPWLTVLLIVPALAISAVWGFGTRLGMGSLAITGVLLALLLIIDALGLLGNHFVYSLPWLRSVYIFISGLGALLAVIIAALCLKHYLDEEPGRGTQKSPHYLLLAIVLVLSVGAVTLRHGVLVRATSRAAEDHLPFRLAVGIDRHGGAPPGWFRLHDPGPICDRLLLHCWLTVRSAGHHGCARQPARTGHRGLFLGNRRLPRGPGRSDSLPLTLHLRSANRARPGVVLPVWPGLLSPGLCLLPTLL
jgi:hypothetical protein